MLVCSAHIDIKT